MVTIIKSKFYKKCRLLNLTTVRTGAQSMEMNSLTGYLFQRQMIVTGFYQRSLIRKTNFSPDQISLTAQTLTSTRPAAIPKSRIEFSLKSVTTFDAFFGQETHNIPFFERCFLHFKKLDSNAFESCANKWIKSSSPDNLSRTTISLGMGVNHSK